MQASLSHYRILEQIGAGGMGLVYRAHDEHLDCDVALKVLPEGKLADVAARKRFRKEALALSKLNHPNIAVVHDFDTQDGRDFLVEELIPGLSLNEMLLSGPLPEREIIDLGTQLADGLAAAHDQSVIHRDLKPSNIRVTPDARLKILDFGLAQISQLPPTAVTASETLTSARAGTLCYMAPEQLLEGKVDERADIWAVGCVLYEMATGRGPFSGEMAVVIDEILHQRPTSPLKLNPHLSEGMAAIILKCLEKDGSLRYASARDIAVDLHRLRASGSAAQHATRPRRPKALLAAIGLVIFGSLSFGGYKLYSYLTNHTKAGVESSPSIAVLPFVDMSPEKDQEYFADGLAEELLNSLARTPGLRVVARTSSFQFKGKTPNLPEVGRKLNAATILEGSVRKQSNRVRITAQLINASDGFHIWSETYDRELNDIFTVQEDIARSVASSLKVTLLGENAASSRKTNEDAYNAYLQGRFCYGRSSKENLAKAVSSYEEAVKLDPRYALAWAGLAQSLSRQADWGYVPVQQAYPKAQDAAKRALALDPTLAEALAAKGWIAMMYEWDWASADASFQRAMELEPGNAMVVHSAAVRAFASGRYGEAKELDEKLVALDPLNSETYVTSAIKSYYLGEYELAKEALNKALLIDPQRQFAHTLLAKIYLGESQPQRALAEAKLEPDVSWRLTGLALSNYASGNKNDSDAALKQLIENYPVEYAYQIAEIYAFRGETNLAFRWLNQAYSQRDSGMTWMKGNPMLKNLTSDPRYSDLLKKMNLAD